MTDMPDRTAEDNRLEQLIAELKTGTRLLKEEQLKLEDRMEALENKAAAAESRRHEYQGRIADLENKIGRLAPLEPLAEFADDLHHLLEEVKH